MSLLKRVRRYAARHAMWRPQTRVLAAVSGGSDSLAMLVLLRDLQLCAELDLAGVVHVNHQLRPQADDDEAFCRAVCERLGVQFFSSRVDVAALARTAKQSIELAGRSARRTVFDETLRTVAADVVATAHTENDQAETVLMRLMRGAGLRGLSGIGPVSRRRIRPLLFATRGELRAELDARGETWREDETNADLRHHRNRVRHELIPYLERHFNPTVSTALAGAADAMRTDNEWLEAMAAAASTHVIERLEGEVLLDAPAFRNLPEAVQRRVALHAVATRRPQAATRRDVAALLTRMEHFAGKRVLVHRSRRASASFRLDLPVPGEVRTDAGWVIEARSFDLPQDQRSGRDIAQIDAAGVRGGLLVRSRRPGDWLRPVGLGGRKKLQDLFVDRKVPRLERDTVPIVTDAEGRIVWVAGHAVAEEFRVTERTKGVIILDLRRI